MGCQGEPVCQGALQTHSPGIHRGPPELMCTPRPMLARYRLVPPLLQVYRKSYREFTDLRLVQQLGGHQGVVWALKFSRNGRYLASGGRHVGLLWRVPA